MKVIMIPLAPNEKYPAEYSNGKWFHMKNWTRFSECRPTEEELNRWRSFPKPNRGLVLGKASGVIALDFDYDIDELHSKIESIIPSSPVKKVGAKGYTAFFTYNGEKSKSWQLNGKAVVELLSDGRQTAMPPSIHPDGYEYRYTTLDTLESIDSLPALTQEHIEKINKLFETDTKVTVDKEVSAEVKSALKCIDPNTQDYDGYLAIGMALQSEFGDKGFEVWDNWAKQSDSYTGKGIKRRFESFKGREDGVSLGTLFHIAQQNGYDPELDQILTDVVSASDVADTLDQWRRHGRPQGVSTGFSNLDELWKVRKGELTIVTGYPNHGKSEFVDCFINNLADKHNYNSVFCSLENLPETHVNKMVQKRVGLSPTKEEYTSAMKYVNDHFLFIKPDKTTNIDYISKVVKTIKSKKKLDVFVLDPYNYLEVSGTSIYTADAVAYVCKTLVKLAQDLDIHIILVAHPKQPHVQIDADGNERLPIPSAFNISGGAGFNNIANNIIVVYRQTFNTKIIVDKVRDQEVDSLGTIVLQYDKDTRLFNESEDIV